MPACQLIPVITLLQLILFTTFATGQSTDQPLTTIAFGSCARERQEQPVWKDIQEKSPDLFLMIGDNHYADFWMKDGKIVMQPVPNAARIRAAYDALGKQPGFVGLKKKCKIMATWDDHDYGANDMGNDFPLREASQQEFVRFFGFDADHPIHNQKGIYHASTFGPPRKRTQIIMLDTRYHRDKLVAKEKRESGKGPYRPTTDNSTTVLGEQQWKWLEQQLTQPADVRIIGSSIQVVADEHGWETWGNFPHEQKRLFELIEKTKANGVVIISGDRHLMEISRDTVRTKGYPIWDFTSSGLTQKTQDVEEANQYRVGPVKREQNFGLIRIDWADKVKSTQIHLEGLGANGKRLMLQTLSLDSLQFKE